MKNLKKVLFLSLFIGLISLSFTKEKTKTIKVFKEKKNGNIRRPV
jgi:hypothetical protein